MKTLQALSFAAFAFWPAAAFACPMCFTGNNSNQDAFLWGSLFLMAVPVTAIGGLLYWAYRRIKAAESDRPAPPRGEGPDGQARANLRLVRR